MANTKISALPVASSTSGPDLYTLVQGGVNKSVTFAVLAAALGGGGLTQLTGDITAGPGTGSQVASLVATSNATLVTLSALALPWAQLTGTVPTWNQDTTGNAANITASSNSTLTTLSSLSLLYSQITGAPAAGATIALDNLASTAVNTDVNPGADLSVNLGSASLRWERSHIGLGFFQGITNAAGAPLTISSNDTIQLQDGTEGTAGYVWTSIDTAGTGSWMPAAAGGVSSVTASAPLASSGGATPNISISQANGSTDGFLSSVDWNTFNSKQAALGFTPENISNKGVAFGYASLDASAQIPITQIPPAALERLVIVADQTARYALTTAIVQNGDTVKQTDTGLMYFVIDDTNLNNSSGYAVYTAGTASSVAWGSITGMPSPVSSLSGTNTGDVTLGTASGLSLSAQILSLGIASTGVTGALSGTDGSTFNSKQAALTIGNLTDVGTDGITITGGTGSVIGSGTAISQHVANSTHNGFLSSTDWNTFNNKLSSSTGNFIINPEALVDTSNWNLYNDSPNPTPAFGTTQDLTYTAVASGSAGNGIIIDYAYNAAYPSNAPFINVISPTHITITYKISDPTLANNPTATQLKAAWDASGAVAYATVAITGVASNLQYAVGTILEGGGDAAPVDGIGGTVTGVTFTRNTVSPISGAADFLLSKDAANRQGEGVSTDFNIDAIDQGETLQINFQYRATSGMILGANSDVQIFVYDITNAILIPLLTVNPYQATQPNTLAGAVNAINTFTGQFKASETSTAYRLIFHIATVNAAAWGLEIASVVVNNLVNPAIATEVPSLVLHGQTIDVTVTDHMAVAFTDGAFKWVPATASFNGDFWGMFGFATNIVGLTADIYIRGYMGGFGFGPLWGYNEYVDPTTPGNITAIPASYPGDNYLIMGKAISPTAMNIQPFCGTDLITSKGGLLGNTGLNDGTGDHVLAVGANGNVLVANSAASLGWNWAPAVVASAGLSYTLATRTLAIVTAGFPTLNQNTTGTAASAAILTTARTIAGTSFNGSANITLANKFIVQGTADAGLTGAQFLGALTTGIVKNTTTTGVLSIAIAGTDYVIPTGVIGSVLTGYVSGAGVVAATDTILQAIQKINGNDALKAPLASPTFTGDVNVSTGNLLISTIGKGLQVKTGANSKIGQATLVAGTVTVANTSVTANSRIFLTVSTAGGTRGFLSTAKSAGVSFTITSTTAETSVVDWYIVESIP